MGAGHERLQPSGLGRRLGAEGGALAFFLNTSHTLRTSGCGSEGTYLTSGCSGSLTHPSCSKRIRYWWVVNVRGVL